MEIVDFFRYPSMQINTENTIFTTSPNYDFINKRIHR